MLKMTFGSKTIETPRHAFVMGIVNATPDSFFDKSRGGVERALELIEQGADILDIGGESTRPGFVEVPAEEEIKRLLPVIKEIRKKSDIVISIDTRKAEVFSACVQEGADVLNDVSALEDDAELGRVAAKSGASVILMHRFNGNETERLTNPEVCKEVEDYLENRINYAASQGIPIEKIIIDPGIGFGKTYEENLMLIKASGNLCGGKYPLLMALSRKRCIGTMTNRVVEDRLCGTLAADLISIQKGAKLVRVHDVKETIDTLNVLMNLA